MTDNGLATLPEVFGLSPRMQFHGEPSTEEVVSPLSLGEGLLLTSNRTIEFSIDFATRLLQLPEFIVNDSAVDRNLREGHVNYLHNCMKTAMFRSEWVSIIECECEEELPPNPQYSNFRMNGQHCGWARLLMPPEYRCAVRHMKYKAKTIQDMRLLYVSIDRGAPRTQGNVINAYLAGTDLFAGVSRATIAVMASGLGVWLKNPKDEAHMTADQKAVLMQTTHKAVTMLIKDWLTAPGRSNPDILKMFDRSPVVAALYETFSRLPSRAAEFWDVVSSGIGITVVNDPRWKLRERLKGASLYGKRAAGKERASGEDMFAWAINAWNAWRAGKELQALKGATGGVRPKAK